MIIIFAILFSQVSYPSIIELKNQTVAETEEGTGEVEKNLHYELYGYVRGHCNFRPETKPLVMVYVEWYVMQIFYPEFKKLFVSMMHGVSPRDSMAIGPVACVGKMLSEHIALDPVWEKSVKLDQMVEQYDSVPTALIDTIDVETGKFTLKRNPKAKN